MVPASLRMSLRSAEQLLKHGKVGPSRDNVDEAAESSSSVSAGGCLCSPLPAAEGTPGSGMQLLSGWPARADCCCEGCCSSSRAR